ncbi:MAG TPA: endonuclease MutS2 [Candidatus Avimonas sp.]|jgi:DNA mismatch repair protein MutS2|nr:endonuclease MutS2 [Clostridiales bacterium]HOB36397.1 endonuclease MutS2 [Candidatus Avimonas sp.]HQA16092.1 endonuclease MutS2 [Candidatus Avimonas sp.]HQD38197.1 endonuclease MutS2 [Candidatus Avimonas sp.]
MNRNYRVLELDKILELLAIETSSEQAAEIARGLEPATDFDEAKRRMDDTFAAYKLMASFGSPSFSGIKNIKDAVRRAESGAALSMRELLDIANTLQAVRRLREWRSGCEGAKTCLDGRFNSLAPNKYLEEKIKKSIISEEEVADDASPLLNDIRRKMRSASSSIRETLDKMVRSPGYQRFLQEPIVTIRGGRFVVPVKSEHRGDIPGLIHDTSSSGATVFIEPMAVVEANNEIRLLISKEQHEIERILMSLSAEVAGFADAIIGSYQTLVELDFIFAKARLAYKMKATEPQLTDDGRVYLKNARHPLLDQKTAVPIEIGIGDKFDTLIITGPNTGGKTVSLKTIGLLTLMAMCGLMIPADDGSVVSVFDSLYADIGDEQSIEQSLSTFSAHIKNIIGILNSAGSRSLVLLDELGAGTDPVEGAALATAIIEHLRAKGAKTVATTHYAELKAYAINTPGVENASCEFDVSTLRPTYRLLVGVPGRSNAFEISKRLGMDKALVDRARELVSSENQSLESVVVKLEEQRQALEGELDEARSMRMSAEAALKEAEQKLAEMNKMRQKEIDKAKSEAIRIIERARREAESLVVELDKIRKEKAAADFAKKSHEAKIRIKSRLKELEASIDPVVDKIEDNYTLPRPLEPGDEVIIADIDKKAVVLSPADDSGNVLVQAGIVKTRINQNNLRLVQQKSGSSVQPAGRPGAQTGGTSRASRKVQTEIDLRGMTTDEGILELDRFISDALMAGLTMVTVIHGKGTGALRSAVQEFLKNHRSVKSFRLGRYGEGESGVTIVEMV